MLEKVKYVGENILVIFILHISDDYTRFYKTDFHSQVLSFQMMNALIVFMGAFSSVIVHSFDLNMLGSWKDHSHYVFFCGEVLQNCCDVIYRLSTSDSDSYG